MVIENFARGKYMNVQNSLARRFVLAGIVCGILADIVYFISATVSLPLRIAFPVFWSFGPLLIFAAVGIYYFISHRRKSVALQIGTIFMIIAGALVTLMGTMQGSYRLAMQEIKPDSVNLTTKMAWDMAVTAADSLQLGADLAWDMFIFPSMILLGLAMCGDARFGKIIGGIGAVIGLLGLGFNIYTFPTPPGDAGLIDVGPLAGLWFLLVSIQMIRHFKTIEEHSGSS